MTEMESNVLDTFTESTGSFRKTRVRPFCLENTRIMIPESWNDDNRRSMGTVNGASAASIPLEVKEGVNRLRVLRGLACTMRVSKSSQTH